MRGILLASVLMCFLFAVELQATTEMAKATGMDCKRCHKGRNIPKQGIPSLKSKGFSHLRKLVTLKGYIPKHNYSQLDSLASTIEANRKKLEGPKKTNETPKASTLDPKDASESSSNENSNNVVSARKVEEPDKPKLAEVDGSSLQTSTANIAQTAIKSKEPEKQSANSFVRDIVVSKPVDQRQGPKKSTQSRKVVTNKDGKVQFKGGKTFILQRPKVKPGTRYSWEEDWSFDDYY